MRYLKIDGVILPLRAGIEVTQNYRPDQASTDSRMADRSLRRQTLGDDKIETTIRGRGIIPPALLQKGFLTPARTISCVQPMSTVDFTPATVITIPAARRSDPGSEPIGHAFLGDRVVRTGCTMMGDDAHLDPVAGAIGYEVLSFPEFLAFMTLGEVSQAKGGLYSWSLTAREI